MSASPFVIALPTADRRRSHTFYREALGLEPVGEPADDGVPEPLQFVVNDGVRIMFVPTGGFGWITGGRTVADESTSECVLTLSRSTPADTDKTIERARRAGATIVTEPGQRPWGYAGAFTDPDGHLWMVTTHP